MSIFMKLNLRNIFYLIVQKDFQAWKEAKKGRKSHPERHTARHLYLESDLDKGLGE